MRRTLLSEAMKHLRYWFESLLLTRVLIDQQIPQDLVVQPEGLLEFFGVLGFHLKIHDQIIAFVLFMDLVSEAAFAPFLQTVHAATVLRHQLLHLRDDTLGRITREVRVDDEYAFVIPHFVSFSFLTDSRRLRRFTAPSKPSFTQLSQTETALSRIPPSSF